MRLPLECILVFLGFAAHASAVQIHARGRRLPSLGDRSLQSRADVDLKNSGDITYHAVINVGGKDYSCLIDTGSSDLWVAGTPGNAQDTGSSVKINYAIGSVEGKIKTTEVQFGGHTIKEQAYLEVPTDKTNLEGTGLIGLGPNSGSNIWNKLKPNVKGITVLDSIFAQNQSTPNYITINLGRTEDPSDPFSGDFTIGEVNANYSDVTNQPKLAVTEVPVRQQGDQHFQILLDKDGILGPDGKGISLKTKVDADTDDYQPTAIVDSGFSLTQVPKQVTDAIYSRFDGAEFFNVSGVGQTWIVPCELEVNITFTIGGKKYPIHPLDATLNPELLGTKDIVNSKGTPCCIGMFQPITFDKSTFDVILGMSFMRNAYTLIDYGDFAVNNNTKAKEDPYVQLLSTTDPAAAHAEFVQVRLGGIDNTGDIKLLPFTASTSTDKVKSVSTKPNWFWYVIIGGSIAGGLFLIAFAWTIFRRKKAGGRGKYAKLDDPYSGGGAVPLRTQNFDLHAMPNLDYNGNGQKPYDPHAQGSASARAADAAPPYDPQSYNNPWDARH